MKIENRSASATTVAWTPSPEKGITSYIVTYGPENAAPSGRTVVKSPRATLPAVPAGTVVAVKAVNAQGLEGWDWARVVVR